MPAKIIRGNIKFDPQIYQDHYVELDNAISNPDNEFTTNNIIITKHHNNVFKFETSLSQIQLHNTLAIFIDKYKNACKFENLTNTKPFTALIHKDSHQTSSMLSLLASLTYALNTNSVTLTINYNPQQSRLFKVPTYESVINNLTTGQFTMDSLRKVLHLTDYKQPNTKSKPYKTLIDQLDSKDPKQVKQAWQFINNELHIFNTTLCTNQSDSGKSELIVDSFLICTTPEDKQTQLQHAIFTYLVDRPSINSKSTCQPGYFVDKIIDSFQYSLILSHLIRISKNSVYLYKSHKFYMDS